MVFSHGFSHTRYTNYYLHPGIFPNFLIFKFELFQKKELHGAWEPN
jgi:hypothetical protein